MEYKRISMLDAMTRVMLERVYKAIIDAGINPRSLKGSATGVFPF